MHSNPVPAAGVEQAAHGYSRDHRPDCRQVVLALVVTTEGLPLTYQLFSGNTHDASTLQQIIDTVEAQYGRADRIWVFDRGLVSQENLDSLRTRTRPSPSYVQVVLNRFAAEVYYVSVRISINWFSSS